MSFWNMLLILELLKNKCHKKRSWWFCLWSLEILDDNILFTRPYSSCLQLSAISVPGVGWTPMFMLPNALTSDNHLYFCIGIFYLKNIESNDDIFCCFMREDNGFQEVGTECPLHCHFFLYGQKVLYPQTYPCSSSNYSYIPW